MTYSMTGYGKANGSVDQKNVTVEIKSLNSKHLDLSLKMSAVFRNREMDIRRLLSDKLLRGRIEMTISEDKDNGAKATGINTSVFKHYYIELKKLCNELNLSDADLLHVIMQIPDVTNSDESELSEQAWEQLLQIIQKAITEFYAFRKKEGNALATDVRHHLTHIEQFASEVEQLAPSRLVATRQKIQNELQRLNTENIDHNRFEQELIYYIEKLDINEELVRLRSHCAYFREEIDKNYADKGKKLHFIAQELGREMNTISAKANQAQMQNLVVSMKDELEKIKEQLMNVL